MRLQILPDLMPLYNLFFETYDKKCILFLVCHSNQSMAKRKAQNTN